MQDEIKITGPDTVDPPARLLKRSPGRAKAMAPDDVPVDGGRWRTLAVPVLSLVIVMTANTSLSMRR